jgi:hypothetical protein
MKLENLLESPTFIDKDANFNGSFTPFYSLDTLDREFEFIHKGKNSLDNSDFWVVIKKDLSLAAIGTPGKRKSDDKVGMEIIGSIDFKEKPDFSGDRWIDIKKSVLQVDGVEIGKKSRSKGYGFLLYLALADAGYAIISDNVQYRGGKALWKRIASIINNDYAVYVIEDGKVKMEGESPIMYDGKNINDADLWSNDASKRFTLFALVVKK